MLHEILVHPGILHTKIGSLLTDSDGKLSVPRQKFEKTYRYLANFMARSILDGQYKFGRLKSWAVRKTWEFEEPYRVSIGRLNKDQELCGDDYRKIFGLSTPDKLLYKIVAQEIYQAVDPILSHSCYSYRRGKGRPAAIRRVRELIAQGYSHVIRYDVRHFDESVCWDRLKSELFRLISDRPYTQDDLNVITGCMDAMSSFANEAGYPHEGKGLLVGSPLSGVLSNIYLNAVDQKLDSLEIPFVRFGDDIAAFAKSPGQAEDILGTIDETVREELHQERNEKKSRIFHLGKCELSPFRLIREIEHNLFSGNGLPPEGGFDFLGFFFDKQSMRIREETIVRIASKIRMVTQRYKTGPLQTLSWPENGVSWEEKWVSPEEITKTIGKLNRRLGYRDDDNGQWEFVGKGWVDSHARCGVTDEMVEQFKRLDRFIYYRLIRFSHPCLADGEESYPGREEFNDMGLRSFMGGLNDFKRQAKQRRQQRSAVTSAPCPPYSVK